jgi:hypothetical protein
MLRRHIASRALFLQDCQIAERSNLFVCLGSGAHLVPCRFVSGNTTEIVVERVEICGNDSPGPREALSQVTVAPLANAPYAVGLRRSES